MGQSDCHKLHALTEFEKYRVVQDQLFQSDYDRYLIELENKSKKDEVNQ